LGDAHSGGEWLLFPLDHKDDEWLYLDEDDSIRSGFDEQEARENRAA
jgi:hypothetical protein